jgi:hypothetical protein
VPDALFCGDRQFPTHAKTCGNHDQYQRNREACMKAFLTLSATAVGLLAPSHPSLAQDADMPGARHSAAKSG